MNRMPPFLGQALAVKPVLPNKKQSRENQSASRALVAMKSKKILILLERESKNSLSNKSCLGVRNCPESVGAYHIYLRDRIFNRISPWMNTFEMSHPGIMNLPFNRKNVRMFAKAEDQHVRQLSFSELKNFGDLLAYLFRGRKQLTTLDAARRVSSANGGLFQAISKSDKELRGFRDDLLELASERAAELSHR